MADQRTFVVIGAGLAGTRAAQALRAEGFGGRVVLLGAEAVRPYDRVTLSKHYLYRQPGFHGLFLHDADFYPAHGIELRLASRAVALHAGARVVTLQNGEEIGYDAALLATGSRPRRWDGPGGALEGVHYLRTVADADRLQAALDAAAAAAGRVVVVGSGWIGCEVAAAARRLGVEVALVGRDELPLQSRLGPQMAAYFLDVHVKHGVTWHGRAELVELRGTTRVQEAVLSDGTRLPADAVVIGIGARPRVELAAAAGAEVDNGIVVDGMFQTGIPGVFAAGDVANVFNAALGRHARLEHFAAALRQGPAAARAMLGVGEPYSQIPFFFSDQYDVWMEYTGDAAGGDRLVVRDLGGDAFVAFWLRGDRLAAGMNVNVKGLPDQIRDLIASGARVDDTALADPSVAVPDTAVDA